MNATRRSLVSLAVIALSVLVTWTAWRLRPPPPPPPGADLRSVVSFAAADVVRLEVVGELGAFLAARAPGGWTLERLELRSRGGVVAGPAAGAATPAPAEVAAVLDDLVQELVALPEIDRFALEGQDPAGFGLADPRWRIDLGLKDGAAWQLRLGGTNVAGTTLYATIEERARTASSAAGATPAAAAGGEVEILQLGTLVLSRIDGAFRRLAGSASPPTPSAPSSTAAAAPGRASPTGVARTAPGGEDS